MKAIKGILVVLIGVFFFAAGVVIGVEAEELRNGNDSMILVAHRAGAQSAPENTIAALNHAIMDNAHMAEIDVQQLRDGTLIVMHDSNFLRTAGVDKNVWEVDYEEFKDFEVGASFSKDYSGEMIPTLDEFLRQADGRICLMIELKHTGHENMLEACVLDKLKSYGMSYDCIIGSQDENILKKVKKLDANINTVYIAYDLNEEQYDADWADSYSIMFAALDVDMVERIHESGKMVYGWTANSYTAMDSILKAGADGIVTDNIFAAKKFLHEESVLIHLKNYLPFLKKMI